MTEPEHTEADRDTAADRVPIGGDVLPPREHIDRISLNRRQSRTIAPPRKWRKIGLRQIVCPECRAIVGSISDGFWHLQTAHNQGKGIDLEAWGQELRDELDEYIDAAQGRRGIMDDQSTGLELRRTSFVLIGIMVFLIVIGIIYADLHH